ncbi:hypothetical protein IQ06DRAFT_316166 [Phaeosphaeriaceae sp. SRC1lsM3a]|nr:hypothetical protein IQ06DRAFT_316166 [Stagonospora sp. SRC1lsM3a]
MNERARRGQKRKKKPNVKQAAFGFVVRPYQTHISRISQQAVVTQAFYNRFLLYFTSEGDGKDIRNRASWLHRLPQLSVDGTNDALALAVQATAFSYCASETHDPALHRHARDLYGQAIRQHGRLLARVKVAAYAVTLHMISTSVLFSIFEAMQATSAQAYCVHIVGAAKMFEVTDPRQCAEGVLCQLFFHLRTQMAFMQLTSGDQRTKVDVRKILHDTLDYEELPIFQRLTTQFTLLAEAYSAMAPATEEDSPESQLTLKEHMAFNTEIDALWTECNESGEATWYDEAAQRRYFRDAFTALLVSYFSAAYILLALTSPGFDSPCPDALDHYQRILEAAEYMQTRQIGCAYMRIAAPLLLVALHAPHMEQRNAAVTNFEAWEKSTMRGMSELARQTCEIAQRVVG